jgi:hypothetical protein
MLLKLSTENKLSKGFKGNLFRSISTQNQEKRLEMNLKSYDDIPGPLGNF